MTHVRAHTRDKEAKIKAITNAFLELVEKNGYSRVSTNHIAKKAEVSIGTVYRYFPEGKQAIIKRIFVENRDEIMNLGDFDQTTDSTLESLIESFIRKHVKVHKEAQPVFSALMQAMLANTSLSEDYQQIVITTNEALVQRLRKTSPFFKSVPEDILVNKFLLVYQTIEAITTRHFYFQSFFSEPTSLFIY